MHSHRLGQDQKLSPLAATLLNSTFIQGFELDDYHSKAPLHSSSLLIPSLLATAELEASSSASPKTISGAEFLGSYIVGLELGPRVGLALHGSDLLTCGWAFRHRPGSRCFRRCSIFPARPITQTDGMGAGNGVHASRGVDVGRSTPSWRRGCSTASPRGVGCSPSY
jgi:MmgE/PrpD N-terminal domain